MNDMESKQYIIRRTLPEIIRRDSVAETLDTIVEIGSAFGTLTDVDDLQWIIGFLVDVAKDGMCIYAQRGLAILDHE